MLVVRGSPVCRRGQSQGILAHIHHFCRQKGMKELFVDKIGLKCVGVSCRISKTVTCTFASYSLQLHLGIGSYC